MFFDQKLFHIDNSQNLKRRLFKIESNPIMTANSYEYNKVIQAIKESTERFKFYSLLAKIKEIYVFKYNIEPIYELSLKGLFDVLCSSLYQFLMMKLAFYHFADQNHCGLKTHSIELQTLQKQFGPIIKQQYCFVMEIFKEKKSQQMQFLFFLICFCATEAISDFCLNNQILKGYFQHLLNQKNDEIQNQLYILMNFQITGINIKPNAYRIIKKKYYLQKKPRVRTDGKMQHGEDMNSIFQIFTPIFHNHWASRGKQKISTEEIEQKNVSEFKNQLKQIFVETPQVFSKTTALLRRHNSGDVKGYMTSIEQNHFKRFSSDSLRNSNAFKERRIKDFKLADKKRCFKENKTGKKMKQIDLNLKQKKNKRNMGLNFISASLKLFFMKPDKKNPVKEIEKLTIAQWGKKIRNLKHCQGFQKASLMNEKQKIRKKTYGSEEDYKQHDYPKYFTSCKNSTVQTPHRLQSQRKSLNKKGFCQFIDHRQPNQIGIVRSIINFSNTSVQTKHKKIKSRDLKNQFEEFNKKVNEHYENCMNQNNYMYRLQKVLTGNSKF